MLFSLAIILLSGLILGTLFEKIEIPKLLGMLLAGIIIGPYTLNLIDNSILSISSEIRQIALIIILIRAGLSLNISDLKSVGRPAVLMCFIPACFEILGMIIIAPKILDISVLDAAIMGSVVAAVSPAVIVPKMLKIMESGYGTKKSIPQMILASASIDDVFVIVIFTVFTGMAAGKDISVTSFLNIPASILSGLGIGIVFGMLLSIFFKKVNISDSVELIIVISIAFLLVATENTIKGLIPFSGLLAVMSMGITLKNKYEIVADRLSYKFSNIWVVAEIMLFVLVGSALNIEYVKSAGIYAIIVILGSLAFRLVGVFVCTIRTKLLIKERLFCAIAYTPKATVQAAIGTIPLSMGLSCGNYVLTVAVVSILITAPIGAFCIDATHKRLLYK